MGAVFANALTGRFLSVWDLGRCLQVVEMAGSSGDLLFSFWTNTLLSVVFLICYAFLKNQPLNLRVYFPRLFVKGEEDSLYEYAACKSGKGKLARYVNVNWRSYLRSFNWILISLKKTEEQLIEDVGLDSTVLVRIFLLGYGSAYSSSLQTTQSLVVLFKTCTPKPVSSFVSCIYLEYIWEREGKNFTDFLFEYVRRYPYIACRSCVQVEDFRPHVVVGMYCANSCKQNR